MHYKITKQFHNQAENDCARFNDVNDAKLALDALFARDHQQKTNVTYTLYDKYSDVIARLDTKKDMPKESAQQSAAASASGSGASSQSGFRPTPFSTTPTPPGGPKKWSNLPEEDKDDEKK